MPANPFDDISDAQLSKHNQNSQAQRPSQEALQKAAAAVGGPTIIQIESGQDANRVELPAPDPDEDAWL